MSNQPTPCAHSPESTEITRSSLFRLNMSALKVERYMEILFLVWLGCPSYSQFLPRFPFQIFRDNNFKISTQSCCKSKDKTTQYNEVLSLSKLVPIMIFGDFGIKASRGATDQIFHPPEI